MTGYSIQGKAVSEGIAAGTLTIYRRHGVLGESRPYQGGSVEESRFATARSETRKQYEELRDKAASEGNETNVAILNSYLVMLDDPAFVETVGRRIRDQRMTASEAVISARDRITGLFNSMHDVYMQARAEDISDISDRVLNNLNGNKHGAPVFADKVILLADDLTPSDTMQLDKSKILAFVTRRGSNLSHTAIIARAMNIPAIVGVDYPADCEGLPAIVDAYTGMLYIEPDDEIHRIYNDKKAESETKKSEFDKLIALPSVTIDGRHIGLLANVGNIDEVKKAVDYGCEGIGLFRTELFYLDRSDYPTEEEQYDTYVSAIEALDGKELVVRTIDVGADKREAYMQMKHEDNPAMGMRAIRYCLGHKDVFKTQLRAIYRAAAKGQVALLLPMIISIDEISQIRQVIDEVKKELEKEGIEYGQCRLGAMIETPAAAIISDLIAAEVDFFSIGTNDLTQYTLAVDRQNAELELICDYHHQAITRMLKMIVDNAHAADIKVCVCGELAADTSFTGELLKMGVDELSVTPGSLLKVKQAILCTNTKG